MEFHVDQDRSSLLGDASGRAFGTTQKFGMTTPDLLMDELKLSPDLIKLDVQGAELQVLAGATRSMKAAQAVMMEGSLIELQKGQALLSDLIEFMKGHDFALYDIMALWHRPLDGALCRAISCF